MVLSPLPYRVRETFKLIKRDVKNLFRKATVDDRNSFDRRITEIERLQQRVTSLPERHPPLAPSTAPTTVSRRPSSERLNTGTTATEYSDAPFPLLPSYQCVDALRADWYKSRPRDVATEERWLTRGIAVILAIALCYWPSNPIWGICPRNVRKGLQAPFTHGDLLLAVIDHSRTREIVEDLLVAVLPGVDPVEFLIHAGDPAQRLADDESNLLHEKFCLLLMPDYVSSAVADTGLRRPLA
ncbi:hypothetical protein BU26DRAFT_567095 [Trematosphaeria pertusa]|uniref:Uncharacterized protein n=1 Tax=Trematosphaeria pertusa TaxID=390896 RepID=A0A6A6IB87_9PLEO|nr:uncharacterized protein BU26DRAFT_567095 [Trematosphaeria pertusa]KAF2246753.1 hypothetical protein BU26DRAFT_567095 [Trematosphaeria pertusa]